MTKARTNASASPAVGRNIVINGAMNVAQRATTVTGIGAADGYFTCDRWEIDVAATSAGRLTMTQTADGPNGISANCIKLDCTTADTSIAAGEALRLIQKLEGQNVQRIGKGVAGAKQITVSFYVKASGAFTFGCELFDNDNSRQITKLFDTTTDWVRQELTFPADEDDGSSPFADDNGLSLQLAFFLHAGSNFTSGTLETTFANNTSANRAAGIDSFFSNTANNFFLTGVQMEIGPVATEFEQEDISVTLGKCQRYFQARSPVSGGTDEAVGAGLWYSDAAILANFSFQKEMRAFPTMSVSGADWGNAYDVGNNRVTNDTSVFDTITARSARFFIGTFAANGTAGRGTYIQLKNGEYIYADAEL